MPLPDFGEYAIWIWPAYACTGFVFVINILMAGLEQRKIRQQFLERDAHS